MQSKGKQAKKRSQGANAFQQRGRNPGRKPRGRPYQKGLNSNPTSSVQTIGAAMGRSAPSAFFKRGGVPQKIVDQDFAGSERIFGCDLFNSNLVNNTTTTAGFTSGNYWIPLSPARISARLQAIEEMYQWFAIRRLKLKYSPTVGSTTPNSIAIGLSTDSELSLAIPTPSQQQVMELQPAMLSPVWGFTECELVMRGTKLFESYLSVETLDTRFQAYVAAAFSGVAAALITTGQMWVEYEIDFYQQTPLLSSVDLFQSGRPCPRCQQPIAVDPRKREVKELKHTARRILSGDEKKHSLSLDDTDPPVLVSEPTSDDESSFLRATKGVSKINGDADLRSLSTRSGRAQSSKG